MSETDSETNDVQFGEVAVTDCQATPRLEETPGFVVACVGIWHGGQLPVYVELDAWRAMHEHAAENSKTELGGVLLGQQYVDTVGRPFVVVHRTLRAKHYRTTAASFTFTHDTWAEIMREKEQLDPALKIVGWYHTHPGWGIFLSSADLFICENYFTNPLDVAIVIDPCRRNMGIFYWQKAQMQKAAAFYVFAPQSRAEELHRCIGLSYSCYPLDSMPPAELTAAGSPVNQTPPQPLDRALAWIAGALIVALLVQLAIAGGFLYVAWQMSQVLNRIAAQNSQLVERLHSSPVIRKPDDAQAVNIIPRTRITADSPTSSQGASAPTELAPDIRRNQNGAELPTSKEEPSAVKTPTSVAQETLPVPSVPLVPNQEGQSAERPTQKSQNQEPQSQEGRSQEPQSQEGRSQEPQSPESQSQGSENPESQSQEAQVRPTQEAQSQREEGKN
jgi:proteasome lid subunit RPN8/RPN11